MNPSISARTRALCTLALCVAPAASGCAFDHDGSEADAARVEQGLVGDVAIYTNAALASGWQSWGWSSTTGFGNTESPLAAGSTSQIKTTTTGSWGALSIAHAASDLTASDYDAIAFDVRAPSSTPLTLTVETLAGASGAEASVPVTTTWTSKNVKLTSVQGGLTRFGKIDWIAPQSGQTFYVDNIRLVPKSATTATTTPTATTINATPITTTTTVSSTYPSAPLTVKKDDVVTLNSSAGPYALYVPSSYDATHKTPTKLLLWMHGCGGEAYGDAWETSPGGAQSWITVSVGGRDGACWNPSTDVPLVLAALDDAKRRLNIDPRRVVIGGYSSGGDIAYHTAFTNAKRFAGIIAENTSPFRDTGASQSTALASAAWKLDVAHLAHTGDTTYPIDTVRSETDALKSAGFPMTRIERAGTHWDDDTASSGTDYDLRTYLLPYLDAGWVAPL